MGMLENTRLALGNGLVLRPLSGMELLQARREALELEREVGERPVCSNACLLSRALYIQGEEGPLFQSGREVLIGLTWEEIEEFARAWDGLRRGMSAGIPCEAERGVNENFDLKRFERGGAGA